MNLFSSSCSEARWSFPFFIGDVFPQDKLQLHAFLIERNILFIFCYTAGSNKIVILILLV